MAANTKPIFPLTPVFLVCDLITSSACTGRQPVVSASLTGAPSFAKELKAADVSSPAGAAGRRVDRIQVKGVATAMAGATTAGSVIIWCDDGYKGYPIAEILTPVVTPSASVASIDVSQTFTTLVLPPGAKLWASTTIIGAAAAHALAVYVFAGDY